MTTFADLGVPEAIARALANRGIDEPFPIQEATIPDGLAGRDICGKAPTGSGKTIAFGIPMVARMKRAQPKKPKGLILAPTRELAIQVADELRNFSGDLRILAVYGGAGIEPQIKQLRNGVDIVVACPGRLLDVIDRRACDLRDVSFVVVDEADRMADMGFLPDVRRILDQTAAKRQTVLFSATLDGAIDTLVKEYQKNPVVHEVADEETGDVVHHFWQSERQERSQLTAEIVERTGPTIVFSRTRHGADRIAKQLEKAGVNASAIHGGRSQGQRERALNAFHRGEVKALVATDVAARGIHVEGVMCVVHFDIPADPKDYVHRSGRTGRAGKLGTVVALVGGNERKDATKLARQADVNVSLTSPNVAALPEGHAAFRTPSVTKSRPARPTRSTGPDRGARKVRNEDRYRTERADRPSRPTRPQSRPSTDRVERSDGEDRSDRTSRPPRAGGSDRPIAKSERREGPSRAVRRGERFGTQDGATHRPADASPTRSPEARRPRPARSEDSASRPARDTDVLDSVMAGSAKVRPSGASRRRAKREAQIAAGIDPTVEKKRRRR